MKTNELRSEPTEQEIDHQAKIACFNSFELLTGMRIYCQLSMSQGSELLSIDRGTLRKHENRTTDMSHQSYCRHITIYYLYTQSNNISLPDNITMICKFFMSEHLIFQKKSLSL